MQEISFNTGIKTYSLGGKVEVSFNPTDANTLKRFYKAFDALDKQQDALKEKRAEANDPEAWFELAESTDKEMRALLDDAFGAPISDPLFGDLNVYALADGLPVWANLMFAVLEKLEAEAKAEKKLTNPRMDKFIKKYSKK